MNLRSRWVDATWLTSSRRSNEHVVLDKDINRTFPDRPHFQTSAARQRLRRVLGAYAVRNTYCQGMSYVAALLLQHLDETHAFWALAAIVESFLPPGYYSEELRGARMDQHIAFAVFLPYTLPRVAAHFAKLEFPLTLIGIRWFLCLFAADFELEHTCRLWDLLFARGAHVLFSVSLGLLAEHEEELLAAPDVPELFTVVRAIGTSHPSPTPSPTSSPLPLPTSMASTPLPLPLAQAWRDPRGSDSLLSPPPSHPRQTSKLHYADSNPPESRIQGQSLPNATPTLTHGRWHGRSTSVSLPQA